MRLKKMWLILMTGMLLGAFAPVEAQQALIVETSPGGQNAQFYTEVSGIWEQSAAKSMAPGLQDASIGSRFRQIKFPGEQAEARVAPVLPADGEYEISVSWNRSANARNTKYIIESPSGSKTVYLDQDGWGAAGASNADRWHSLGVHTLPAQGAVLRILIDESDNAMDPRNAHRVYADAFRFAPPGASLPVASAAAAPSAHFPPTGQATFSSPFGSAPAVPAPASASPFASAPSAAPASSSPFASAPSAAPASSSPFASAPSAPAASSPFAGGMASAPSSSPFAGAPQTQPGFGAPSQYQQPQAQQYQQPQAQQFQPQHQQHQQFQPSQPSGFGAPSQYQQPQAQQFQPQQHQQFQPSQPSGFGAPSQYQQPQAQQFQPQQHQQFQPSQPSGFGAPSQYQQPQAQQHQPQQFQQPQSTGPAFAGAPGTQSSSPFFGASAAPPPAAPPPAPATLQWVSYQESIALGKQLNRPILLYFAANTTSVQNWEREVLNAPQVQQGLRNFVLARIQFPESSELVRYYGVSVSPTLIFLGPDGYTRSRLDGPQPAQILSNEMGRYVR